VQLAKLEQAQDEKNRSTATRRQQYNRGNGSGLKGSGSRNTLEKILSQILLSLEP
jgi:hypothetical protein